MKKILIIEDDRILMETTSDFLREEGYEVLKAVDGAIGIEMACRFLPDLILCDISMPKFDGYQVYSKLESGFSTQRIPFIFMTAKAEREDVRMGMQMGADDYITKPINFKELKKTIRIRLDKSEKIVQKSEAKYRALFELAKDAILIASPGDGRIVEANKSCCEMLGYLKEELIGSYDYKVFAREPFASTMKRLETVNIFEAEWMSRSGVRIPVQIGGTGIDILDGNICLLIVRNNTELVAKEVALKVSEERYRDLVENTGEGLGVVDADERFTYANPAACEIFGLPPDKMIGSLLPDFLEPSSAYQINQQTAIRKEGQKSMYELEIIRPDNERRWIIVTATPQFHQDGHFSGTFGIFRDITLRKLAEANLQKSENRLREIVDLTNDWIWEIDPEWKYQYVSSKIIDILGYSREEMIGRSPFEFLLPEDVISVKTNLRSYVHEFKPLNFIETRALHKSGKIVYLESSGVPVFNDNGKYLGYRGADRDITLRKLYEKELIIAKEKAEESDKLKSSILANISHELRTPLNGILGFAEILREELKDTEYNTMAGNIHSSGRRLMITLNSIITLSQLEAGKISISPKKINLKDSIGSVVKSMEGFAIEKQIKLNTSNVSALFVESDEHLFKQLFRHILDNAIKFTEHGNVVIETNKIQEEGNSWHIVQVTDTGIGIGKEYFDIIFQEFRQVSEGFGRQYQGSGIGLTISKKIIDLLNGKITLESELGKGSTFNIWLPAMKEEGPKILTPSETERVAVAEHRIKSKPVPRHSVLLVEDNQVNKDLTLFFLRNYYLVDFSQDAETALQMIRKKNYSAVLMDINLGIGMNGLEATKEIRKIAGYEKTPIIAVTGYTMHQERETFLAVGCTHYIAKPFDQETLLTVLSNAIPE